MKSFGPIRPRVGWRQRTSVSTAFTSPERARIFRLVDEEEFVALDRVAQVIGERRDGRGWPSLSNCRVGCLAAPNEDCGGDGNRTNDHNPANGEGDRKH